MGSDNIVHNLRVVHFSRPDSAYDWAQRFGNHAHKNRVASRRSTPTETFPLAVQTPDHFLPLLYLADVAADSGQDITALIDGHAAGSNQLNPEQA